MLNDLFLPFAWLAQYGHVLVGWYYIHARSYTGTIDLALRIINFFTLFKDETYNYIVRIIFFLRVNNELSFCWRYNHYL